MVRWWKRPAHDEGTIDLRGIDDVIDVRHGARNEPAAAPVAEPSARESALEQWERSADLVEYSPDQQSAASTAE